MGVTFTLPHLGWKDADCRHLLAPSQQLFPFFIFSDKEALLIHFASCYGL